MIHLLTRRNRRGTLSRRMFLGGSAGLLALPMLDSLLGREARAGGTNDVSILFMTQAVGTARDGWWPAQSFGALSASAFPSGHSFASLADIQQHLLFVRGLAIPESDNTCAHAKASAGLLTGQPCITNGSNAGGTDSIDVAIARHWDEGQRPPLVVVPGNGSGAQYIASHLDGYPTEFHRKPAEAFDEIVGLLPSDGPQAPEAWRLRGKSILDSAHDELCSLRQRKLGAADQKKLDAYLEGLRGVEQDIAPPEQGGSACQPPTTDYSPFTEVPAPGALDHEAYAGHMLDIAILSLVCGHRRSATLHMGGEADPTQYTWLPEWIPGAMHHGISHYVGSQDHGEFGGLDQAGIFEPVLQAIDRWHAEALFGRAIRRLLEIPDGDGTMLDRMGVVAMNAFSFGRSHSKEDLPIMIGGTMRGYFKNGHYVEAGDGTKAQNGLLTMLGRAAGLDIESFGATGAAYPSDELSGLRGS